MKWLLRLHLDYPRPLWFHMMTSIGPKTTDDLKEAMTFKSKREALAHPANMHPLCFWSAEKKPAALRGPSKEKKWKNSL